MLRARNARVIRIMDFLFALVLLPFALLIFVLLLLPELAVFRRIFYVSQRAGQGGKLFTHVKLQTMYGRRRGASPGRAHLETERIPPWGGFLRKTHLDEIPEIVFILMGLESFVGPRPLLPEHAALVSTPERALLKPGWTGLSQIFLKRRGILPGRIQRRLDRELGRKLCFTLYFRIL
ncbi:MAG: sugar transferase, partial [Spirochaetaceae bacterium]|nr:sugar transferase [Spirochaetaceae bacterium]